jgi:hypothetical protein
VANGMREADIALEVTTLLGERLMRAGHTVLFSRPAAHINPGINARWQLANKQRADYFVSVHANAGGGTGVETLIPTASPNNPNRDLQENRRFAEMVSAALANALGMRVRRASGVMLETETRHGSIGVLRHTRMIAILPEIGFIDSPLSNPDVDILRNRRSDIAQALADGILQFLDNQSYVPGAPLPPCPPYSVDENNAQRFPIDETNIQRMVELGVIGTPGYWRGVTDVQWLNELLENAGRDGMLDHRIDNGITDIETALNVLHDAGVMDSPGYWRNLVLSGDIRYLGPLIVNIANRSRNPLERIIHAEARGEDLRGQVLVGNVIMNRHRSSQFPNGIREVIFQHSTNGGRTVYQFSPVTNGAYARATDISALTRQAVDQVLDGVDFSNGALFFRSTRGLEGSWHQTALRHLFTHGGHAFFS